MASMFHWLTSEQSADMSDPRRAERVRDELADVFISLVRLADILGVDLLQAEAEKIERNEHRIPAELFRGRADKYSGPLR